MFQHVLLVYHYLSLTLVLMLSHCEACPFSILALHKPFSNFVFRVVNLQENPKNELIEALIPKHLKGIIDCDIDRPEHAPGIGIQFQCLLKDGLKPFQHVCLRREHYYFVGDYSRARKPEEPSYFVGDYSGAQEPDSPEPDSY